MRSGRCSAGYGPCLPQQRVRSGETICYRFPGKPAGTPGAGVFGRAPGKEAGAPDGVGAGRTPGRDDGGCCVAVKVVVTDMVLSATTSSYACPFTVRTFVATPAAVAWARIEGPNRDGCHSAGRHVPKPTANANIPVALALARRNFKQCQVRWQLTFDRKVRFRMLAVTADRYDIHHFRANNRSSRRINRDDASVYPGGTRTHARKRRPALSAKVVNLERHSRCAGRSSLNCKFCRSWARSEYMCKAS